MLVAKVMAPMKGERITSLSHTSLEPLFPAIVSVILEAPAGEGAHTSADGAPCSQ